MNINFAARLTGGLGLASSIVVAILVGQGLSAIVGGGLGLNAWSVLFTALGLIYLALQWALWRQRRSAR